jgi:hypothetical protein
MFLKFDFYQNIGALSNLKKNTKIIKVQMRSRFETILLSLVKNNLQTKRFIITKAGLWIRIDFSSDKNPAF